MMKRASCRLLNDKKDELVGKDAKDLINGWSAICANFFKENGDQMTVTLSDVSSVGRN
jgi:hypothetical protein